MKKSSNKFSLVDFILVYLACVAGVERGRGRGNLGARAGLAGYCLSCAAESSGE